MLYTLHTKWVKTNTTWLLTGPQASASGSAMNWNDEYVMSGWDRSLGGRHPYEGGGTLSLVEDTLSSYSLTGCASAFVLATDSDR